jgi:hypothetical protein
VAGAEAASPLALWLLLGGGMATIGLLVVLVQAFGLRDRQRPRAARRR